MMENGLIQLPDCRTRKLSLQKTATAHELKYFQKYFAQLVQDYKIETIVIRQRPMKGKFAGGAIGFKLEAALELLNGVQVIVMPPTEIKTALKESTWTMVYLGFRNERFVFTECRKRTFLPGLHL